MHNKYVTSLETSQKLKEILGDREPSWYWFEVQQGWSLFDGKYIRRRFKDNLKELISEDSIYPAYLTDELLEILPKILQYSEESFIYNAGLYVAYHNGHNRWDVFYSDANYKTHDKSLPEALAKMIIYLHENKLYEFKKEAQVG